MIEISYISTTTEPVSTDRLLALLQQSLTNNARAGVTGLLLYGNATFLQALEGEEKDVDALFGRIEKDQRHTNIRILHHRPIERRRYADWSMGFKRVSDQDLQDIKGLRDISATDITADYLIQHPAVAEKLMDHFRTPYWDPLVRELDEKEALIKQLKRTLANTRSRIEVASLVLESVADAARSGGINEGHANLCALALNALRAS